MLQNKVNQSKHILRASLEVINMVNKADPACHLYGAIIQDICTLAKREEVCVAMFCIRITSMQIYWENNTCMSEV